MLRRPLSQARAQAERHPKLLHRGFFSAPRHPLLAYTTAAMAENDRPASPSPEERERLDKEAKQREQEEQSKLPYKWTQTIGDVDLSAIIPANIKGKDLDVKITKTSLKAGIRGQEPIIDVGSMFIGIAQHRADTPPRALSLIPSRLTNQPGRSRQPPRARNSASTSTRSTRWNGGPMS